MEERKQEPPKVVVKRIIRASREDVFDAWTKPNLMEQWFFAGSWSAKSRNDLRIGGSYHHEMISDGSESTCKSDEKPDMESATTYLHTGEYLEIVPPERLVFTWNSPVVKNARVTVELQEKDGSTEVTITHELLDTDQLRQQHTEGWGLCLENLERFTS